MEATLETGLFAAVQLFAHLVYSPSAQAATMRWLRNHLVHSAVFSKNAAQAFFEPTQGRLLQAFEHFRFSREAVFVVKGRQEAACF